MREKTLPLLLSRVLVVVFLCYALVLNPASGFGDEGRWQPGGGGEEMEEGGEEWGGGTGEGGGGEVVQGEDWFLMRGSVPVIQTYAGTMTVLKSIGIRPIWRSPIHIGFITMEPQSLFIPQYLDSNIIFYIKKGEARIGHIYKDELAERELKTGDIYRISAGSVFYIVNTAEGQRLQIICSINTATETMGLTPWTGFQSFFVGGGLYPTSILAGFDSFTMAAALNGSMMAPHINPRAIEFGIVLEGNGTIQIVFPNGTMAMYAKVGAGDVFWVPKFFPFCQIASRAGPFVFFGFTTSSKKNWPVMLVGRNSVLQQMRGPEMAASFGWTEERLANFTDAQLQSTIFPSQFAF